jgi:hypothetical protein
LTKALSQRVQVLIRCAEGTATAGIAGKTGNGALKTLSAIIIGASDAVAESRNWVVESVGVTLRAVYGYKINLTGGTTQKARGAVVGLHGYYETKDESDPHRQWKRLKINKYRN